MGWVLRLVETGVDGASRSVDVMVIDRPGLWCINGFRLRAATGIEAAPLPRAPMPYKHNEPRCHKIPKAKYKVSNWREYDQALQQRGSLTVWVTPEALEAWAPEKTGRRGRPTSYSDIVIETAVMLRLAMGKPWRQTKGMLSSIIRMLGLDLPVPEPVRASAATTPPCPAAAPVCR